MPVKHSPKPHLHKDEPLVTTIPDVFTDGSESTVEVNVVPRTSVVVEVEQIDMTVQQDSQSKQKMKTELTVDSEENVIRDSLSSSELEAPSLPKPTPPPLSGVSEDHEELQPVVPPPVEAAPTSEQKPSPAVVEEVRQQTIISPPSVELPAFFNEELHVEKSLPVSQPQPEVKEPVLMREQTPSENYLESVVPQAFVGGIGEVASEMKNEKKGVLITLLIVGGMLLLGGGLVGLYVLSSHTHPKTTLPPLATDVNQAPIATPTIIIHDASPSATPDITVTDTLKSKTKVSVLNGTKTAGLAAKQAALLKKAGFVIGTVGNGDPKNAGTITVPIGDEALGAQIQQTLSSLTFTVNVDPKARIITVIIGQ